MSGKHDSEIEASALSKPNVAVLIKKYSVSLAEIVEVAEENNQEEEMEEEIEESDEESFDELSIKGMTFTDLQVAAFSAIIQETLDKIKILGMIGGLPNVKATLEYCSIIDKYEKEDTQSFIFDPETLEPYEGGAKKQTLIKFQKDRSYIEEVLKEAHADLLETKGIDKFLMRLKQFSMVEEERLNLLRETSENLSAVKNFTAHMEKDKIALTAQLQKKSEILGNLKDKYEDLIYENDIKWRYVDNWERARCAQNQVDTDKKEEYYSNIIRESQHNYDRENRINLEIESYLTEMDETYVSNINMWMEKYDRDLEAKEVDIQYLKEKRDGQITNLENLSKLYETHTKEIEDYLIKKEERRKENELMEKMNAAATKIQAWWRGTMYRKGLGPYRKKKGKKDKKGKKK